MTEYDIETEIDQFLKDKPEALKRVKSNRRFVKQIQTHKVKDDKAKVKVFGVKDVNINAILKDNIWNRSIFTTDKLCRLFLSWRLSQLKKYEAKKRSVPLNMMWIVLIMVAVVVVILVVLFLLPSLGVM